MSFCGNSSRITGNKILAPGDWLFLNCSSSYFKRIYFPLRIPKHFAICEVYHHFIGLNELFFTLKNKKKVYFLLLPFKWLDLPSSRLSCFLFFFVLFCFVFLTLNRSFYCSAYQSFYLLMGSQQWYNNIYTHVCALS